MGAQQPFSMSLSVKDPFSMAIGACNPLSMSQDDHAANADDGDKDNAGADADANTVDVRSIRRC